MNEYKSVSYERKLSRHMYLKTVTQKIEFQHVKDVTCLTEKIGNAILYLFAQEKTGLGLRPEQQLLRLLNSVSAGGRRT